MLGATLTTHGGLIAAWTIDNPDYNTVYIGLSPNNDVTYNPGGVSASLTGTGNGIDVGNVFGTGGTTLNDPRSPQSATYALFAAYSGGPATVTVQVNATGLSGFSLSYAAVDLKTGGGSTQDWKWSTDGITYTGLPDSVSLGINTSTWSMNSVDFSSASVSSPSTLYFQNTIFSGIVGFDNLQVNAVPEPSNYALAAFGLCICFGRRFIRKLARA